MKLTSDQRRLLELADTATGRMGWKLSIWEGRAERMCRPLIEAGLLIERRLNHYPGVQITDAGRAALRA